VIAALAGAVVLLAAFVAIEARSSHPLLPLRILADRNRSAGYLSAAAVGVVIFAVLYFATLFFQQVWGYSALKSSVAYLPWIAAFGIGAAASAQLLPRIGPRPLMVGDRGPRRRVDPGEGRRCHRPGPAGDVAPCRARPAATRAQRRGADYRSLTELTAPPSPSRPSWKSSSPACGR
jgi:hypothetical protein